MGKLVMGYWDCPYCDTKGIRGDQSACPGCGQRRGQVKFYMKGQAQDQELKEADTKDLEYVQQEKEKYVNRNPDWYCSFCETLNSDNAESCQGCGASRSQSEMNYFQMLEKLKEREQAQARPAQPEQPAQARRSRLPVILIVIALAAAGLFLFMNGKTTSGDYRVSGVRWERAIEISRRQLYHETGWSVPQGASVTGQSSEIHHYDSVIDHYENYNVERSRQVVDHYETYYTYNDLGNGMFEQVEHERPVYKTEYYTVTEQRPVYVQVPRYQTKYRYDVWRWTPERTAHAEGNDQSPLWPETNLKQDEREEERTEAYYVEILNTKKNEAAQYRVSQSDWNTLKPGDPVYITTNRMGGDPYITDEKGNPLIRLF